MKLRVTHVIDSARHFGLLSLIPVRQPHSESECAEGAVVPKPRGWGADIRITKVGVDFAEVYISFGDPVLGHRAVVHLGEEYKYYPSEKDGANRMCDAREIYLLRLKWR